MRIVSLLFLAWLFQKFGATSAIWWGWGTILMLHLIAAIANAYKEWKTEKEADVTFTSGL